MEMKSKREEDCDDPSFDFDPDYHPHPDEVVEGEPNPYPSFEEEAEWFEYEDDSGRFWMMPANMAAHSMMSVNDIRHSIS